MGPRPLCLRRKYCILGPVRRMQYDFYVPVCRLLVEHSKKTCYSSQKGNPFNQRRGQDQVVTNVVRSFRPAGNCLNGSFTAPSGTDTCTPRGKTCAYCTITTLYRISTHEFQRDDTWF